MKNTKKLVFTSLMLLGMTSLNIFAEIPNNSVLIGNMTYDLDYALDKKNFREIRTSLQENENDIILVKKDDGLWYENFTGKDFERYVIPQVFHKNQNGQVVYYDIFDGKIIEDVEQFTISNISVISDSKLQIEFNQPIATNEFKGLISINDTLLDEGTFQLNERKTVLQIDLPTKLKKENLILSVKINEGITSMYGDKFDKEIVKDILVVNGDKNHDVSKLTGKEFNGNISVLSNDITINDLKIKGGISVYANNFAINNSTVSGNLVIENKINDEIKINNSNINKLDLNAYKSTGLSLNNSIVQNIKGVSRECIKILLDSNSDIKRLQILGDVSVDSEGQCDEIIVYGDKNNVDLKGKYKDVILSGSSKLKIEEFSTIDTLNIASLSENLKLVLDGGFNKINIYTEVEELFLEKNSAVKNIYSKYFLVIKGDSNVRVYGSEGKVKLDSNINSKVEEEIDRENDEDQKISFVKFKEIENIELIAGNKLILPEKVQGIYSDNSVKNHGVTWDSKNVDINKPGIYKVEGYVKDLNKKVYVEVKVIEKIVEKEFIGFKEIDDIEVMVGNKYELPGKVVAMYSDKTTEEHSVVWDTKNVDVTKPGIYTVEGYVKALDKKVYVKVNVKEENVEKEFIGFKEVLPIDILVGNKCELPGKVVAMYSDGSTEEHSVVWDTKKVDIFKPGTYTVEGYVKDLDKKISTKVNVVASLEIKEIPKLEDVILEFGDVYALPARIPVILESGETIELRVEWNGTVDTNKPGVYNVEGTLYGTVKKASLKITVKEYVEMVQYWIKKPQYSSYENILKSTIEARVNINNVSKVRAIADGKEIENIIIDSKGNFTIDVSEIKEKSVVTIKVYDKNGVEVDSVNIIKTI